MYIQLINSTFVEQTTNVEQMKCNIYFLTLILLAFTSCKINQKKQDLPVGLWIYKSVSSDGVNIQKGRYNNKGQQKGTWRYRQNGKLYRKEKYRDSIVTITLYHPNGKRSGQGKAHYIEENNSLHFYYNGLWKIYDIKGKKEANKHYEYGILINTQIIEK